MIASGRTGGAHANIDVTVTPVTKNYNTDNIPSGNVIDAVCAVRPIENLV